MTLAHLPLQKAENPLILRMSNCGFSEDSLCEQVASPVLEMNVLMRQGAYEAQYIRLTGVSQSYLKQLDLGEGRIPASGEMGMVFGNGVLQNFMNAKTGKGYWDTGELPDVDLMGKPVFVVFDMDAYYQSQGGATGDDGNSVKPPKSI